MGMNSAGMTRFMERVDSTLKDLFPANITIGANSYDCAGVGGDAAKEYLAGLGGGQAPTGTRYFRLEKSLLATRPESGTRVTWNTGPESESDLEVISCPDRPHETSWVLVCGPRQR